MDKTKKILLVAFATLMVINLQFNTPLTKGMDDGFSLSQLFENVYAQESSAEVTPEYICSAYQCCGGWNSCGVTLIYPDYVYYCTVPVIYYPFPPC